jgi:CTP synthase
MSVKYIFVTGGVVSGLGKGITAASLGRLLKNRGYKVTTQKFDPYINVDPGTMSPYQHGEVFVTEDGAETDLDLGHYERFINENLTVGSNITSGKVYYNVINKEREGKYLGRTVQVIPHITDEIKEQVYSVGKNSGADIVITEIGGTVGDIESLPFLEAIRQVGKEVGRGNAMYIHVTLLPTVCGDELKSKPTQHSVKELLSLGIQPNIVVCRSEIEIPEDIRNKISLFCNVRKEDVIQNLTAPILYEVPLWLEKEGLPASVCYHLEIENREVSNKSWADMVTTIKSADKEVRVGIVGKYAELPDAYLSVAESLRIGGYPHGVCTKIDFIQSEDITAENAKEKLGGLDGILVPGGFGDRGIEGKIEAVKYCRENGIPFFGICLGMQVAVVEFARNVLNLKGANSSEFDEFDKLGALVHKTEYPVIDIMPDQKNTTKKGGTMRLGAYPCKLRSGSLCRDLYGSELIYERHRHRFEFNNEYRNEFEQKGMLLTGKSPDDKLVEIVELPEHKWFVGVQFHPEFKSRPNKPHPLFADFIKACMN